MAPNTSPLPKETPALVAEASTLADLARFAAEQSRRPETVAIGTGSESAAQILLVPDGYKAQPVKPILDEFRTRPQLRAGTTELLDLDSFIAWTKRHADANSVVYANDDMTKARLTVVVDHDEAGPETPNTSARFGRHRGTYAFPLSREWQEWTKASGVPLSGSAFAEFFERRIGDVLPPPYSLDGDGQETFDSQDPEIRKMVMVLGKKFATPSEIVKLTRGIEINVDARAVQKLDRDTGEQQVEFEEVNGTGVDRVKPPNAFLIAIPVVNNGPPILIAVHLRYRVGNGKVVWFLEMHQPERVFEEMFRQALREVEDKTAMKPLRGRAPDPR